MVFEHRLIREGEGVAIKTETRRCAAGLCECDSGKSPEPASAH